MGACFSHIMYQMNTYGAGRFQVAAWKTQLQRTTAILFGFSSSGATNGCIRQRELTCFLDTWQSAWELLRHTKQDKWCFRVTDWAQPLGTEPQSSYIVSRGSVFLDWKYHRWLWWMGFLLTFSRKHNIYKTPSFYDLYCLRYNLPRELQVRSSKIFSRHVLGLWIKNGSVFYRKKTFIIISSSVSVSCQLKLQLYIQSIWLNTGWLLFCCPFTPWITVII